MEGSNQLFLVEFLIDRVNIPAVRAIHQEMLPVTTCVSFQILSLPPISIHEEASIDGCACVSGDTQVFKKGKSCLFALPSNVLQKPVHSFPVTMSVYKKLPPGVLPDVMLIGSHQIQLKNLVNDLLSERIFKNGNPCKSVKSTFRITTATGQSVGEVTVFIRVSCFGKKIVTQFQIPHNKKPYLFKGADDSPVFQCKKIPSEIYFPEPVRCSCPVKKSTDGSGEGKTCCTRAIKPAQKRPMTDMCKPPAAEPRPCCPSRQPCCSPKPEPKCCAAIPPCASPPPPACCPPPPACCPPPPACCPPSPGCCPPPKPSPAYCPPPPKPSPPPCCFPPPKPTPPCCFPPPKPAPPPCCFPPPCGSPPPSCLSYCPPQPGQDTCSPCCGPSPVSDVLFKEKSLRKCGCAVKEEQSCDCRRTSC